MGALDAPVATFGLAGENGRTENEVDEHAAPPSMHPDCPARARRARRRLRQPPGGGTRLPEGEPPSSWREGFDADRHSEGSRPHTLRRPDHEWQPATRTHFRAHGGQDGSLERTFAPDPLRALPAGHLPPRGCGPRG